MQNKLTLCVSCCSHLQNCTHRRQSSVNRRTLCAWLYVYSSSSHRTAQTISWDSHNYCFSAALFTHTVTASSLAGVQSVGVMHSQVPYVSASQVTLLWSLTHSICPSVDHDNTVHISMQQGQLNYYRHQELSACHSIVMCVFHNHLITTQPYIS